MAQALDKVVQPKLDALTQRIDDLEKRLETTEQTAHEARFGADDE